MKMGSVFFQILWLTLVSLYIAYFSILLVHKIKSSQNSIRQESTIYFADDEKTILNVSASFAEKKDYKALYFIEAVRQELDTLLHEKYSDGSLKLIKPNGKPWNVQTDSLRVFTSLNIDIQAHAEWAVKKQLKAFQPDFQNDIKENKHYPYNKNTTKETFNRILKSAQEHSPRFVKIEKQGLLLEEINEAFSKPIKMKVFGWNGYIDTILSPTDSIKYSHSFLQAGLLSVEPKTGFVKAWVGGANSKYFPYDHVLGARQVGSLIKPFVYSTGLKMGVVEPCTQFSGNYCVGNWCPGGRATGNFITNLTQLNGTINIGILSKMGEKAGVLNIANMLKKLDIHLDKRDITPPMILGTFDVSLKQIVPAYSMFVNNGQFISPTTILRIEDKNGKTIYRSKAYKKQILSPKIAHTMLTILKRTVTHGSAIRLSWDFPYGNIKAPTSAKTGATQSNSDGWFVGLTPDLVTGIWVGGENPTIRWNYGYIPNSSLTMSIYGYYMNRLYADPKTPISQGEFVRPEGVNLDWLNCMEFEKSQKNKEEKNPFL